MNKREFGKAYKIAISDEVLPVCDGIFDGFGLNSFTKVYVTIKQVASLIRWQALRYDGGVDSNALNEIGHYGRDKFMIIDEAC